LARPKPDSYAALLDVIQRYQAEQGLDELPRAARRWFEEVFRPLWAHHSRRQLTAAFPGKRPADLIARLAVWRAAEAPDLDWHTALEQFLAAQEADGSVNVNS